MLVKGDNFLSLKIEHIPTDEIKTVPEVRFLISTLIQSEQDNKENCNNPAKSKTRHGQNACVHLL